MDTDGGRGVTRAAELPELQRKRVTRAAELPELQRMRKGSTEDVNRYPNKQRSHRRDQYQLHVWKRRVV